jgi:hypothetical protein
MVHYSVVIPERNGAERLPALLAELERVLAPLVLPYEIICVDDGSSAASREQYALVRGRFKGLRWLRFDEPRGTSAALSAGVAASRGEVVIAISTAADVSVEKLPHLISHLSRHDLVMAQSELSLWKAVQRWLGRPARALTGSALLCSGESLYWAAKRRAVSPLALSRGAFRLLPEVVAKRGYRVCQLTFFPDLPVQSSTWLPGFIGRIAARWLDRRFEPHRASEAPGAGAPPFNVGFAPRDATLRGTLPSPSLAASDLPAAEPH